MVFAQGSAGSNVIYRHRFPVVFLHKGDGLGDAERIERLFFRRQDAEKGMEQIGETVFLRL